MLINFVTSNLAPFRIDWLDEIAKTEIVTIFYNDDIVKNVNSTYIERRPTRANYVNISKYLFKGVRLFDYKKIIYKKTDLLILDGYGFLSQIVLMLLLKMKKIPFVLSVDGGFINENENVWKYRVKKLLFTSASFYLSTSEMTDFFLRSYGAKVDAIFRHRFTSIYQVDVNTSIIKDSDKSRIRRTLDLPDKFTVIGVGKTIYGKGFDVLLKALKFIKAEINVLIVGGKETEEYHSIIISDNITNVVFIDFCDKELLNQYYSASDVFVLPTRSDVWGLVINEAMAKGLPVITTNKCMAGITLIENGENGFIIPIDNEVILANCIDELANSRSKCLKMGRNNLKRILEYTLEKSTEIDILNFKTIIKKEKIKNG